ncbi:hypothetical protein ACQV2B_19030 [Pantoea allii]|uniref:hypothetical protein n=1 Tax=Pantoea allii TaxID=574096 RepID=UPI003D31863E
MEIKLTAAQVAEIVDSDERVKQAVVSLYLQRNIPSLTISDLLVGQQHTESAGSAIGSLTTQQMMDACIADNAVAPSDAGTDNADEVRQEDAGRPLITGRDFKVKVKDRS